MFRNLAKSLLLHGAALLAIVGLFERATVPPRRPMEITVVETPSSSAGSGAKGAPKAKGARAGRPRIEDLAPSLGGRSLETGPVGLGPGQRSAPSDGYSLAEAMTLEQETERLPFLRALWARVDSAVSYPEVFVRERIQGQVSVHFRVGRDGRLVGDFLKVDAADPYLQAYVLAILAFALREPLPQRSWGEETITAVSRFNFEILTAFSMASGKRGGQFKNVLEFRREAVTEPLLNETIQRWMTRYLPPIIPVPGGWYIDFIRAYQMVTASGEGLSPDQRDRVQLDLSRERWETVLKQKPEAGG